MGTCADQLRSISDSEHAQLAVDTAVRILYLRTTTQIDELMQYASTAVQQRWDFLGPATDPSQPPDSRLFEQIDNALQWTANSDVGEYIRHAHFALELTEDQAEVLNGQNVRFFFADRETAHVIVPFAVLSGEPEQRFVVDLIWEDGKWKYFDTRAVLGPLAGSASVAAAIDSATVLFASDANSDDDYWGQYSEDDGDEQPQEQAQDVESKPTPALGSGLMADSLRHALAAAAAAAKAMGVTEAEFLQLAASQFNE
ncbi:hypothetical protein H4S02_001749 [Coemansia sp. RSA 2611]|nr:hypothetical protein H4S01_002194 [Coemansia sp. RSA 2610]KAJ2390644.1 hypothetical protein H4S02_001749 [Coemansia sp. RSA 2611]